MELFAQLCGMCVLIPVAAILSVLIIQGRKRGKISNALFWVLLASVWMPIVSAILSQAYWIFVVEPARSKAGMPIE